MTDRRKDKTAPEGALERMQRNRSAEAGAGLSAVAQLSRLAPPPEDPEETAAALPAKAPQENPREAGCYTFTICDDLRPEQWAPGFRRSRVIDL